MTYAVRFHRKLFKTCELRVHPTVNPYEIVWVVTRDVLFSIRLIFQFQSMRRPLTDAQYLMSPPYSFIKVELTIIITCLIADRLSLLYAKKRRAKAPIRVKHFYRDPTNGLTIHISLARGAITFGNHNLQTQIVLYNILSRSGQPWEKWLIWIDKRVSLHQLIKFKLIGIQLNFMIWNWTVLAVNCQYE